MKNILLISALILLSLTVSAKKTTTNSKSIEQEKANLKAAKEYAYITSIEYRPITKRTYELETKRKGSTKGYKIVKGRFFKAFLIVK